MKDENYLKAHNARSMWHPMTAPSDSLKNPPAIITGGQGVRITDIDGHEVVDAVGGLWNVNLGYSCQPVKDAMTAQLERLPYYSTFRGTSNDCVIELAEELRKFFEPDGLVRAFFTSGGSDSVETALGLADGIAMSERWMPLRSEATTATTAMTAATNTARTPTVTRRRRICTRRETGRDVRDTDRSCQRQPIAPV